MPRVRAPGAILPLQQPPASNEATATPPPDAPPQQTAPAQETPIVRAFTLFQPPAPPEPPRPTESEAAVAPPADAPSPDPAADATALKVPVPKARPAVRTHSATAQSTTKPAKVKKPVIKPDTEN
jgi:hypothetical protein